MAHLKPVDKVFEDADDTGVLILSGRNLRTFPVVANDLLDYSEVFEADFSKNRLDRLPKEVVSFKSLVKLTCHHNSLRYIPEEISILPELKKLDLSHNYIQSVPPELCRMKLESLKLRNNRLVSLPLEFGRLSGLLCLNLSCNSLQELPPSFCELQSVQHCDLHRNELKDIPEDLHKMDALHFLDISSNQISRIPSTFRLLPSLQTLRLMDNPLETPPTELCRRGLVHIFKYLDKIEKRGSSSSLSSQRDESLRRRRGKKSSLARPMSESTPIKNGGDGHIGLYDEMASLVHKTFGDGDTGPSGSLHWSVAQYKAEDKAAAAAGGVTTPTQSYSPVNDTPTQSPLTGQSKEDYREAAQRLYMHQERQMSGKLTQQISSSPTVSSKDDHNYNTSPMRRSDDNMIFATGASDGVKVPGGGRSLPNEKQPRSGSWNTHMRMANTVLPNKYNATPPIERARSANVSDEDKVHRVSPHVSRPSSRPQSEPSEQASIATSPKKSKSRPAPLDVSGAKVHQSNTQSDRGDSDREGSITPTNEEAPSLDDDEPTTPKEKKLSQSLNNLLETAAAGKENPSRPKKSVNFSSVENLIINEPTTSKLPANEKSTGFDIQELEGSPMSRRRASPILSQSNTLPTPPPQSNNELTPPIDSSWIKNTSPRRKKEKDVFKFLKDSEPNYTIRRQQLQMNLILEKNQHVKKAVENLLGVELADDIGEWVSDGVLLCELINKLHPGTITSISTPPAGQKVSKLKQTINISAFIEACKKLKVPEEELCSAGDIIEMKDPVRVISCLQRVLETKPGNLV